ncbi:CHAT domain-containing protein [Spongiactinospora sp. TRM90649]|uniref:CHAT domain-containing protein n=1 Tax=Spongiactinospora sp. TRM90649 TaxID=3031114 RepID=UPI0023F9D567|nr:CHAT domain-containing protein [Spongiactinospora sp. TRM90649]MDF5757503.1 CHAT domain-containing protein [Spongiactinospora sp. TRM90649]
MTPEERLNEQLELGRRFVTEGGAPEERERLIAVLEEVLAAGGLSPQRVSAAECLLGLMLMLRVVQVPLGPQTTVAGVFASPPPLADLTDSEIIADLDRARTLLGRISESAEIPPNVRSTAALLSGASGLLDAAADLNIGSLGGLLERALGDVEPGPGQAEMQAILAWSKASEALAAGEPADVAVREAERAADALGEAHLLRPMLLAELAVGITRRSDLTEIEQGLSVAGDLMSRAWREMIPHRDHPLWSHALRRNAGLTIMNSALTPGLDKGEEGWRLAEQVAALPDGEPGEVAGDWFMNGVARLLLAYRDGDEERYGKAVDALARAMSGVTPDDAMWPATLAMLGASLSGEWLRRGGMEDAEAADVYLKVAREHMREIAEGTPSGGLDLLIMRAVSGLLRAVRGDLNDGPEILDQAVTELTDLLERIPGGYPLRAMVTSGLGAALLRRGMRDGDLEQIKEGARLAIEAAEIETTVFGLGLKLRAMGGMGMMVAGTVAEDIGQVERGLEMVREATEDDGIALPGDQIRMLHTMGGLLLTQYRETGTERYLGEGVEYLSRAVGLLGDDGTHPVTAALHRDLAEALMRRDGPGDRDRAVGSGLAALAALEQDVLMQTDVEYGLAVAGGAAEFARRVAGWCLARGDHEGTLTALERGRGLVLNAATAAAGVPDLLRDAGHDDLAAQWRHTAGGFQTTAWRTLRDRPYEEMVDALIYTQAGVMIPSDLRHRVLVALDRAGRRALPEPSSAAIAQAVKRAGMDALVYLVPGGDRLVETVLALRADGTFHLVEPEGDDPGTGIDPADLDGLCEWAGRTVLAPLLRAARAWAGDRPPRLVLVPMEAVGRIPWHAARLDGRYACQDAVISFIASGRQLAEVARRPGRPLDADVVMIANPTLTLSMADPEVQALHAAFYPMATVYGPEQPFAAGPGTPGEVLGHLPTRDRRGASLLHLACHARTGATPERSALELALELAGEFDGGGHSDLAIGRILRQALGRDPGAAGGLVVLSACETDRTPGAHDEALTLATAFLAAGAATVVGSRWRVGDLRAAGLTFMFHHHLRTERPADALRLAQLWMLDPARVYPATMPDALREDLSAADAGLADIRAWAAFTHQGM